MSKFCLILLVVWMLQASRACEDDNEEELLVRQQSDEYFAKAYGFTADTWNALYNKPSPRLPDYANLYEGRTPLNKLRPSKNPFKNYFNRDQADEEENTLEGRLGGLGASLVNTGLFNNRFTPANTWRPLVTLAKLVPISVNPNSNNPLGTFNTCTSPSGDEGICTPGAVCSLFGGRPGSSCNQGQVCCINVVNSCGAIVTLNNTYWQTPTTALRNPCSLTVRMDPKFVEQSLKPICQIRLDFVSFTTSQPTAGTCTDTFQVGGVSNAVPTICGDNTGQHMYLHVPTSSNNPIDVQLMFNFASGTTINRTWNIKIAMLPCGTKYLAPVDCLQYFTAISGKVSSFNWMDVAGTRQLNSQNYNICFRTELISSQKATKMCLSPCTVTNGDAFSITTPPAVYLVGSGTNSIGFAPNPDAALNSAVGTTYTDQTRLSGITVATCLYDYLLIPGGRDANNVEADRYCGNELNPSPGSVIFANVPCGEGNTVRQPGVFISGTQPSVQVCTPIKPFKLTYRTDGQETAVTEDLTTNTVRALADVSNTGFCLDYQER
ncbi:uncharacterized protein LOC124206306 [Daphnia pulex]|uniref:uncharacterized protein LOC124206306 n=1 Tax=Daphnia pulex TaxID=6669 RepID=UPI001EE0AF13|nr:uncharacterized protein LOC124206306 [Daphnia pulex]